MISQWLLDNILNVDIVKRIYVDTSGNHGVDCRCKSGIFQDTIDSIVVKTGSEIIKYTDNIVKGTHDIVQSDILQCGLDVVERYVCFTIRIDYQTETLFACPSGSADDVFNFCNVQSFVPSGGEVISGQTIQDERLHRQIDPFRQSVRTDQ